MEPVHKRPCRQPRSRAWVLTIFGSDASTWEDLCDKELHDIPCPVKMPECTWCILSLERAPTTGRLHLQGAVYYHNAVTLSHVQSDFGVNGHYEVMRGTPKESEDYCSKDATHIKGPWVHGTCPKQGKRTDWETVKEKVIAKVPRNQILMESPHLAPCFRGVDALIEAARPNPEISRDITVYMMYGPTGTGKTHRALMSFPDAYVIRGKLVEGKSFDLYNGESCLVLDEWDPREWPITTMNTLLDKWKCPLQCRYQNKYALWTKVIITTNIEPDSWYNDAKPQQLAAFQRRITHTFHVQSQEDLIEFS